MHTAHVEFDLTLPSDRRYGGALRDAVVSAALAARCRDSEVSAFGRSVEEAAGLCADRVGSTGIVSVSVRRGSGTLEVTLTCDGITRVLSTATVE